MHSLRLKKIDLRGLNGSIFYKDEGGFVKNAALLALSSGAILCKIPRKLGATELCICATLDGESGTKTLRGEWLGIENELDLYLVPASLPVGLYFYHLEIKTPFGTVYGLKELDYVVFSYENEGSLLQLTVSDFKHSAPSEFFGGIIYHVFVDRFARHGEPKAKRGTVIADYSSGIPEYPAYPGAELKNNTFYGGSLYGVIDKLDYIASLGANIIYLSPIFESPSNHKYDTSDYMHVDEAFGGDEALDKLIASAHEKGIKIILDGVFNHTGADSIYFNRYSNYDSIGAYQSKESPYFDWYDFQSHPNKYTCWWNIEILPRINTRIRECADFFTGKNGVVEKYSRLGIDGFRLDVADELSDDFIAEIKSTLSSSSKGSILYGEVWEDASNKIAYSERKRYYLGAELDGVMNYPLRRGIIDYLTEGRTDTLSYALCEVTANAPERIANLQMNLLGTHDTERILTVLGGESASGHSNDELVHKIMSQKERAAASKKLKTAYAILATLPGIPAIFYGDEAGLEGYSDPFNRMPYPWGAEDKEILDFYKKIGIIRRGNEVYKQGSFALHALTEDLLLFSRKDESKALVTALNNSQEPITLAFASKAEALISEARAESFVLKPHSVEIFATESGTAFTVEAKESCKE